MYIVRTAVKNLANKHGKMLGRSYVAYLERRVYGIVLNHINTLGSRKTLNAEDAEALDAYRMTRG